MLYPINSYSSASIQSELATMHMRLRMLHIGTVAEWPIASYLAL